MLTDLQLLAMTIAVGAFFIGLIHWANWQHKNALEEKQDKPTDRPQ